MAAKNRVNKYFVNVFNFFTILEGYIGAAHARLSLAGRLAATAPRVHDGPSRGEKFFRAPATIARRKQENGREEESPCGLDAAPGADWDGENRTPRRRGAEENAEE
jgi:hypothetical protein